MWDYSVRMFSHIFSLRHRRNLSQAIGFYVVYVLLFLFVGSILGTLGILSAPPIDFSDVLRDPRLLLNAVAVASIVYSLVLAFGIIEKKGLLHRMDLVAFALLSGVFAILGGILLGLVPAAYLTTKSIHGLPHAPRPLAPQKASKKVS